MNNLPIWHAPAPSSLGMLFSHSPLVMLVDRRNLYRFTERKGEIVLKEMQQNEGIGSQATLNYPRVSVVVPAHNEAKNLQYVLPYIPSIVTEVILVDGHSDDDTIAVAQQLLPTIRVIQQTKNGKGNALRLGFAACSGDIIITLDADGSMDPREIPTFIEALLAGNDFAKGSRFVQNAGSRDLTWIRRLGCLVLDFLASFLFKTRFSDICYGYYAFWRCCLDSLEIDCDGFEVEALINIRMHKAKRNIIAVPSIESPRIYGKSHLNIFRDGWRFFKTIVKERCQIST
jgi:glycosyltransferase involved in cell wall biosynthesis